MPRQFGKTDASATWTCALCPRKHAPGSRCPPVNAWLVRGGRSLQADVIWLKRSMPDGQWPPDLRLPRDDSFSWWVRAHCGHHNGARQFAFYEEKDADVYETVFRSGPCQWTRCRSSGRRA